MQHHGAPTRLLDWSVSPFVAAYFACRSGDGDGAVWAVHKGLVENAMKKEHGDIYKDFVDLIGSRASIDDDQERLQSILQDSGNPPLLKFADTNFLTDRMERQQGRFSFCNQPHEDHDSVLASVCPSDPMINPLVKIIIRDDITTKTKREFMAALQQMNITGFSLFPDLDGVGRYAEDVVRYNLKPL